MAAGGKSQSIKPAVDLSWPTMLCATCKTRAQHGLYNEGIVDVPCTCLSCLADPPTPLDLDGPCNCSGCIHENIPTPTKPVQSPTILSTIPPIDRISTVAGAYGETVLIQFRKNVWRADSVNCILGPEIYVPDNLIKEVLDRWSQLDSLSALNRFLAPYPRLRDHAQQLLDLSEVMQVEFNRLDAVRKAEAITKRQARDADGQDETTSEPNSTSEDESDEDIAPRPVRAKRASRVPLQTVSEVSESYGSQRTTRHRPSI
jgi:hypothetical protein